MAQEPWWGSLLQSVALLLIGASTTFVAQWLSDRRVAARERTRFAHNSDAAWNLTQQEILWEAQEALHRFWHQCVSANAAAARQEVDREMWLPMRTEWLHLILLTDRLDNIELAEALTCWRDELTHKITGQLPLGVPLSSEEMDLHWLKFQEFSQRLGAETRRIRQSTRTQNLTLRHRVRGKPYL
jgi:hypothetical protein